MTDALLQVRNLSVRYGDLIGLADVSLVVPAGKMIALLGSNGSGKSHFLRLLAAGGSDPDDEHLPAGDVVPEPVAHTGSVKLGARVRPPAGQSWLGHAHRQWLFGDALPAAAMVWIPAFFAYLLLIALVPGDCRNGTDGVRHCTSPAWIFAAVWTPYFIVEAIVRAMRSGRLTPAARE